ncbi:MULTISPECIES: hypothetical protein [Streptomyces]|uniref:Bi-functional transferase/deacetylase n=1 Tax=Streptomyces koelreuteriae TaxID=2838015 RepID=A0ABX8FRT3_9ACTN|nr:MULTISPECIES: hypothetical protein [Streptomyces]QWB23769.1 hypothetical protein KJK29_14835 [Streptomyces koelreuteriae]UUA06745.1 hypothetical protein NNW98_14905 [Streptomyces koelreuteriae]UUA14374.1 hypothetical protein NNW99_14900 [Streptomyces sp. CRCS-T-1]
MHSEPAIESRVTRGRRRKRGNESAEGPVFVDNSGRRARLLRRIGLVLGVVCLGYAAVLGAAFMGWGTSLTPSQLLPFAGAGPGGGQPQGGGPQGEGQGGVGPGGPGAAPPSGVPSAPPQATEGGASGSTASPSTTSPSASPSASASAAAGAGSD